MSLVMKSAQSMRRAVAAWSASDVARPVAARMRAASSQVANVARISLQYGPEQHLQSRVSFPERLGERFQSNKLTACQGEPACPGLLPHRSQQAAMRLNALYAVDKAAGIDVDQAGRRQD